MADRYEYEHEWRITYVKRLGEKQFGIKPNEHFRFFKKDVYNLGPDYCAFLECRRIIPEGIWTIFARIFVGRIDVNHYKLSGEGEYEVSAFYLVDDEGDKIGEVKEGMIHKYLEMYKPSPETFLKMIDYKK